MDAAAASNVIAVAASVAAIVMALIGGLTAIILKLLDRDRTKTDRQLDKTAKDVVGAQIDFATVRERVSVMWDERGKCEALELEVVRLTGDVARAAKATEDVASMKLDIASIKADVKHLPQQLLNAILQSARKAA